MEVSVNQKKNYINKKGLIDGNSYIVSERRLLEAPINLCRLFKMQNESVDIQRKVTIIAAINLDVVDRRKRYILCW